MKSLAVLCAVTVLGIAPAAAQTYTTNTNRVNSNVTVTTTNSSSGSSWTTTQTRQSDGSYRTQSTYVPAPPPSSYQPMKGYCPLGNCK